MHLLEIVMENAVSIGVENLINLANVLYLLSYFVRDMLKLRIFTVVGASCLVVFFYAQPEPIMTAIYWNFFFIALNLFWVVRLIRIRRRQPDDAALPVPVLTKRHEVCIQPLN